MIKITHLKAFNDNYIWLIIRNHDLVIVDPGQSPQVIEYIENNTLNLCAILLTHKHNDHIGGVADIVTKYAVPVYGPDEVATIKIENEDNIVLHCGLVFQIISTPGHTAEGISYLLTDTTDESQQYLFCGDTLFAAGCGRVFTQDYPLMYASLNKLKKLSSNTLIYPGHEYTLKNLEFATYIEPENQKIPQRIITEKQKISDDGISLPSSLAIELQTNPFLRCNQLEVINKINQLSSETIKNEVECFTRLRNLKDNF